jgi:hypothetical protein
LSISNFNKARTLCCKYCVKSGIIFRRFDLEREKFDFDDAQEGFLVDRLEQFIDWNFYQKNAEIYQDYSQSLTIIQSIFFKRLSISNFNKARTLCCKYCVKSGIIFRRFSVFILGFSNHKLESFSMLTNALTSV